MSSLWETIIGLEIHVELNTKSKLFSPAANHFGDDPNTNIADVCTGQPGTLPVLNREAVNKAIQFGLGINAMISPISRFDRKSYFYPDSPRNFQITQFYHPIIQGGSVIASVDGIEKEFFIDHAHLEDDAGTLKHFSHFSAVDYNRAGVALIEIVSKPCMHSGKEAAAYAEALKAILEYLEVSDCNMDEGSLRIDVNISVRERGEKDLRPKVEIKNMNSFAFMEKAIESEVRRQVEAYLAAPGVAPELVIKPATYRWDPEKKETVLMRSKESAEDYRYFPEPDLPRLVISSDWIEQIKKGLPELPLAKQTRYKKELLLSAETAEILTSSKALAHYFEEALAHSSHSRHLANWITVEFQGRCKQKGIPLTASGIPSKHIAELVNLIEAKTITGKIAKAIADIMIERPGISPEILIEENPDFKPLSNEGEVAKMVEDVVLANPQSVTDYHAGRDRAFGFLVGQVMKRSGGKATPELVNALLKQALSK